MLLRSITVVFALGLIGTIAHAENGLPVDLPAPEPTAESSVDTNANSDAADFPGGIVLPEPETFEDNGFVLNIFDEPFAPDDTQPVHWRRGWGYGGFGYSGFGYRRFGGGFGYGTGFRFGLRFGPRVGYGFGAPFGYSSYRHYRPYLWNRPSFYGSIGYQAPFYRSWSFPNYYNTAANFPAYYPAYNRSFYFSPQYYSPVGLHTPQNYYYGCGSYGSLYYSGAY